ncbi:MAG TPA: GNAT family N-acetyltransferase [Polyangiaceae bacterium]
MAFEPTPAEVAEAAPFLAAAYNEPHNRAMMANTVAFGAAEVAAHYAEMRTDGARTFLLERDGVLVGDADLRNFDEDGRAEIAILVASPDMQGRGLGTRFALLLHALAFGPLACARIYASIVPENAASRRLFEKLGYALDTSDEASAYTEEEDDLVLSVDARALSEIVVKER